MTWIVAAGRTAVAPSGGALAGLMPHELAAPVIRAVLQDAGLPPEAVDELILSNALGGGGNPARIAALASCLPISFFLWLKWWLSSVKEENPDEVIAEIA